MPAQHIFAGNPLDRGERERRDEKWIKDQINNPTSKFLPIWESRVLVSSQDPLRLGWLDSDQLANAKFNSAPFLLGMLESVPYHNLGTANVFPLRMGG